MTVLAPSRTTFPRRAAVAAVAALAVVALAPFVPSPGRAQSQPLPGSGLGGGAFGDGQAIFPQVAPGVGAGFGGGAPLFPPGTAVGVGPQGVWIQPGGLVPQFGAVPGLPPAQVFVPQGFPPGAPQGGAAPTAGRSGGPPPGMTEEQRAAVARVVDPARALLDGAAAGTLDPNSVAPANRVQPGGAPQPQMPAAALLPPSVSGPVVVNPNGTLRVGGLDLTLAGASIPPRDEMCGGVRCGALAHAAAASLLNRLPVARCAVHHAAPPGEAAAVATCSVGREDLAELMAVSGAARASSGGRILTAEAEAKADGRGIWSSPVGTPHGNARGASARR